MTTAPVHLDPERPVGERVEAIMRLLTPEQRPRCLGGIPPLELTDGTALPGITADGYEAVHGVGMAPNATMFPQVIGLGSTWDTELVEQVGAVVAEEARSLDPAAVRVFGPVADLRTNPLAGRYEEGFGEDPFHVGTLATAYAFGLRGRHPVYVRTLPVMKHFLAYNHEWQRHRTSSSLGVRAFHESQAVPYKMPIASGAAAGIMTAYNLVNGVPAILHPLLRRLRGGWAGDDFLVLPDGYDIYNLHHTKSRPLDTWEAAEDLDTSYVQEYAALAGLPPEAYDAYAATAMLLLKAGHSYFDDGSDSPCGEALEAALEAGTPGFDPADADRVVRDWLAFLIRSGRLDGDANPYGRIEPDPAPQRREASAELARRAAREQLVLLKNEGALLPLPDTARVAVVGPLADLNLRDYYSPMLAEKERETPLQAIADRIGDANVRHHPGLDTVSWQAGGAFIAVGEDGVLRASASEAEAADRFAVYDWGYGKAGFRCVRTGRHVDAPFTEDTGVDPDAIRLRAVDEAIDDGFRWFPRQFFDYRGDGAHSRLSALDLVEADITAADVFHLGLASDGALSLAQGAEAVELTEVPVENGPESAARSAAAADYAVVVVGSHPLVHARETSDRPGLDLAPRQTELVRAVAAAKPGRTVVVIMSSYPFAIGDIANDPNVAAIVYSSHAGQAAGSALAEALFGDHSPAGRLSSTWLADTASLPQPGPRTEPFRVSAVDMLEYDVIEAGLTYRYSSADPVYAFGHGLTYTAFAYSALSVPAVVHGDEPFTVSVDVANTGSRTSDEVVQVYARSLDSAYGDRVPRTQLAGFARVSDLRPGETRPVAIAVDPADLFVWDAGRGRGIVESGRYAISVGAGSADLRLHTTVRIEGEELAPLDLFAGRNVWEAATVARDLTYWEVAKLRTAAGEDGCHSTGSRRVGACVGFTKAVIDGARAIELRCATTAADWADLSDPVIEIRAGAPDGELLGEARVPLTGDLQSFADVRAPLTGAAGTTDLYLRFRASGIYVDTVRLYR